MPAERSAEALPASVHRAALPWSSVPFDDGRARRPLEAWQGLDLIPYLVLLDQRGHVLASRGRDGANDGPLPVLEALRHPWRGGP